MLHGLLLHTSSHRPSDSTETALKVSMTAPQERRARAGVDAAGTVTRAAAQTRLWLWVMSGRERTNQPAIFFNGDRRYVTQIRSNYS